MARRDSATSNLRASAIADALTALDSLPALAQSRRRVLALARAGAAEAELAGAVESDPALVIATLRLANERREHRGAVASISSAVAVLGRDTVAALAESARAVDQLENSGPWGSLPERFRLHAVGVGNLVLRLAHTLGLDSHDELLAAALLHDVGELALQQPKPPAAGAVATSPEAGDRLAAEREACGIDHAELGGALARRWRLPEPLAQAIETHHTATSGAGLLIRLADLLSYYSHGRAVDIDEIIVVANEAGLDRSSLGELMYQLPEPIPLPRRAAKPCPLSARELEVLRKVATGVLPKQIAYELGLAESTVRNHLHRIYKRIGAADRAQATLMASERGWI